MIEHKGTITWLPIKDAPRDGTLILVAGKAKTGSYYNSPDNKSWDFVYSKWENGKFILTGCMNPTHFAYINPPEVKE